MATSHTTNQGIGTDEPGPFKCQVEDCEKGFATQKGLSCHRSRSHRTVKLTKQFQCRVEGCEKVYYSHSGLSYHLNTKHSDAKGHGCTNCPKTFSNALILKLHQGPAHGIWLCTSKLTICSSKEELNSHRTVCTPGSFPTLSFDN
jgi:hypothetical protein